MIDGNSTFYPLIDIPGSNMIKDPSWKNLFPIKYFSQVIIPPKVKKIFNKINHITN